MLSLQSQEHEKAPLPVKKKKKMVVVSGRRNVLQWLRQEMVSQMC